MEDMIKREFLEVTRMDLDHYQSLPLAVYCTLKDGTIMDFNQPAAALLNLSEADKGIKNIESYYLRTKERKTLIGKLSSLENGEWEKNQTLNFRVEGKTLSLRFFAKTYKTSEDEFLGSLCLVFQITEFERFRHLEEDVHIGFFEVAEDFSITYSNSKFREILSISDEYQAKSILDFFPNKESAEEFSKLFFELKKPDNVTETIFDLVKTDKTPLLGRMYLVVDELDEEQNVVRIKGVLEDITFIDILDDVPIGLFSLKQRHGTPLLLGHCNIQFAQIFGRKSIKDCIGKEFSHLINNDKDFADLEQKVRNLADEEVDVLPNYLIRAGLPGQELIINIKKLPDRNHNARYAGVIYDVTDDVARRLSDWQQDFASFLHSYSAMSNSIRATLSGIISSHGTDVVKNNKVDTEAVLNQIRNHIQGFRTFYRKFLEVAKGRGFDGEDIERYLEKLNHIEQNHNINLSLATIRNIFINIRKKIEEQDKMTSKELLKGVTNEISEIFRYIKLINLHNIEQETYEMGVDTEQFKTVLTSGEYTIGEGKKDVMAEIKNAVRNLNELAERKNAEVRINAFQERILLRCHPRMIYLAFYNVLNNAIKYSWTRANEKKITVNIDIEQDGNDYIFCFTNRGVGISAGEIKSGKLFQFGNRGSLSSDRSRKGNGIGLWHTKKIITRLNGSIKITSEPLYGKPDDFKQPFITKVTIILPDIYE